MAALFPLFESSLGAERLVDNVHPPDVLGSKKLSASSFENAVLVQHLLLGLRRDAPVNRFKIRASGVWVADVRYGENSMSRDCEGEGKNVDNLLALLRDFDRGFAYIVHHLLCFD